MKIIKPVIIDDSVLVSTTVPAEDLPAYNPGTTYGAGEVVVVPAVHRMYESLQGGNQGYYPPESTIRQVDPAWWLDLGPLNAWRMVDGRVGSQTTAEDSIEVVLQPGLIEGVALFNVVGAEVEVVLTDPVEGEVYRATRTLISTANVFDAYTYCFEPFLLQESVVWTDLPPYSGAELTATITAGVGEVAACGELVVGRVANLGDTQWRLRIGIVDYSVKQVDDFGDYYVLERAFSNTGSFMVALDNGRLGMTKRVLEQFRATPVVWIPTEVENLSSPLMVYGFYSDFNIEIEFLDSSLCSLEIEGLT